MVICCRHHEQIFEREILGLQVDSGDWCRQVSPDISTAPLKLQVFQVQAKHAKETCIGHLSKLALATAQDL